MTGWRVEWGPAVATAALSVFFLVGSVVIALQFVTDSRIQSGPRVSAAVERVAEDPVPQASGTRWTTDLDVRFSTRSGRAVRTTIARTGRYLGYTRGDEIAIRYDPKHPEDAELAGQGHGSWKLLLELLAGAAAFGGVSGYFWRDYLQTRGDDEYIAEHARR